jgi:general secretion pathway protein F
MPAFTYHAMDARGLDTSGTLEAADRLAAAGLLQQRGLLPLKIASDSGGGRSSWWPNLQSFQGMAQPRLICVRTLSFLLTSGVPLDRALAVSAQLSESALFRQSLEDVLRAIKGGKSLSSALESHPRLFPSFYVSMIRAGETSGNLGGVLTQLADYQESANELRSHLISSMIYPALLVFVGGISVLFLMELVVPKFATVFQQAGAALPLPTQILLFVSQLIQKTWWIWLLAIPLGMAGLQRYLATAAGRKRLDYFVLTVPKLGSVVERVQVSRFARSLGTLLQGGVPMVRSLEIARQVVGNQKLSAAIDHLLQGVKQGKGLVRPLEETGAFPPLSIHLIGVGEETGRLDATLLQVANVYERETRTAIKNLVAFFEPCMILAMGLVVGAIVISILLAIYSINDIPM